MQNTPLQTLLTASYGVLRQLHHLAGLLSPLQYTQPLELIHGNTIGKHYRHVIEFYQCLLHSRPVVNYDKRKRDTAIENSPATAIAVLDDLLALLQNFDKGYDNNLVYKADFSTEGSESIGMSSSFERELAYNIEHAVHHMAILQIVINHYYKEIELEEGFGVAASTLRYQQQTHVHSNLPAPGAN